VFPSHPHRVATPVTRRSVLSWHPTNPKTFLPSLFCFLTSQPFFLTLPPVPDSERGSVSQLPRTFRIVLSSCLSLACVSSSLDRIRLGPFCKPRNNTLVQTISWPTVRGRPRITDLWIPGLLRRASQNCVLISIPILYSTDTRATGHLRLVMLMGLVRVEGKL
jgi:hypothetical protein